MTFLLANNSSSFAVLNLSILSASSHNTCSCSPGWPHLSVSLVSSVSCILRLVFEKFEVEATCDRIKVRSCFKSAVPFLALKFT